MDYKENIRKGTIVELLSNGDTREVDVTYTRAPIKGGFTIMYKDERDRIIIEILGTKTQYNVFAYIEKKLHNEPMAKISPTKIAKELGIGRQYVSSMVSKLVKHNAIMEIAAGRYIWNPFVSLPQFEDGQMLQKEWNDIIASGSYKRRGSNLLDEYYAYKRKNNLPKLTFDKYMNEINIEKKIEPKIIKGEDDEY